MSKNETNSTIFRRFLEATGIKSFFDALKKSLQNTAAAQQRITTTTAKTIGKALASFDEVNVLKMPTSGSTTITTTTTVQQPGSTEGNLLSTGLNALMAAAGKMSQLSAFIKLLTKLPGALSGLIEPGQRSASILERITGFFRQSATGADALHKQTEAVALSAGKMANAWSSAAMSVQQWKKTSVNVGNTDQISQGIRTLSQQVQNLANNFRKCDKVSTQALSGVKNNWQNLHLWFRSRVADPIIRDTNHLLEGITDGFNQVFASGSFGGGVTPLSAPQIPHLARGAVLPANKPFLAVVGDQKNGTNVEAPLETIKQAVAEVVGSNDVVIRFSGDLAQLARVLRPAIVRENARVGGGLVTKEVL